MRFTKRRYEIVCCDVSGCDRTEALERVRSAVKGYGEDTALRVLLTGEVKNGLLFLPEEIGIGAEYPYLLEIKDQTVLAPDFTDLEQSRTLEGAFYRLMREKRSQGEWDAETLDDALKYGLLALQDRNIADLDLQKFET